MIRPRIVVWEATKDLAFEALDYIGQNEDLSVFGDRLLLGYSIDENKLFFAHLGSEYVQGLSVEIEDFNLERLKKIQVRGKEKK